MNCPECDSKNIAGLVAAFWIGLDEDGGADLMDVSLSSETEIGPERMCRDCGHEFALE